MRFFKLLGVDLRQGTMRNIPFIIATLLLPFLLCVDLTLRLYSLELYPSQDSVTAADYFVYIYGGMKEYIPDASNPFCFPVVWIIVFMTPMLCLSIYPLKDLHSFGIQIIYRAQSRRVWWISKCAWNICSSLLYHGWIILVSALFCVSLGIPLKNTVNPELLQYSLQLNSEQVPICPIQLTPLTLCVPVIISISLNLLQLALALHGNMNFSQLAIAAILLISAYCLSPFLVGNYAMIGRLTPFGSNGIEPAIGMVFGIGISTVSIIYGVVRFSYYDILNGE